MKNWKKILGLGLSAALSLSLLASCGGGATTESAAPSAPAESQAVESQGAESAAPAELKTVEAGKLHMSTNAAFPPYEMTTDNGGFEGIDVEVAEAIAKKLGLELVVDDMDFDAAQVAVQQGKSDICMAGLTVNEERKAVMDFSDTYATGIQVIIVKEGSDVTLDTLGDQLIGTQRGTTGETYCTDDYGADHVVPYDNGITAVQALMNDQVDCVVIDSAPASEFVAANPGLVILDTEYTNEDYAIGFAKGNTALLEAVNGALAELTADGTVQSILDKYIVAE
ncbi:ABC transporter substrate-binding protein [Pseudoflavonifractor phocaeensis]|uniref:ABC transporter substrate-binding protein n=1 Tax=Pseudoflavonifractor phocaeensis TaxID=1870988 RepID=UPI00313B53C4